LTVAYFIRRRGDICAVIEIYPDNREGVVQDGLSMIEAEILCAMKIEDLPKPAARPALEAAAVESALPKRRSTSRQLELKMNPAATFFPKNSRSPLAHSE
jgi:hypothetical protein